ncbi:enoyl-CoA hydratase-related protein [Pseudooceanicola sp. LIPI14-2-Ac024]|uniref:enoyl-CoA hydratase-related protein n=1 Tax=Pseudooceanicola sp. LIPI14-2-Ac024 TaxID=3344875 RepID=UPI0035CEDBF4
MNQIQQPVLVARDLADGVMTLTLGGGKAHPLSLAMIEELTAALEATIADDEARVILLHGPGPIFCAGHDLKEINRRREEDADDGVAFLGTLFDACARLMVTIAEAPKPTIALVEGIATAAGLQMVASCDMAFAAPAARFQLPGVNNGGFCSTPSVAVSRAVSRKHLMELLLSGEQFDTDWALNAGLVNRVLPADHVVEETRAFARTLAGRNAGPITNGIRTLKAQMDLPLAEAYALSRDTMIGHFTDPVRMEMARASKFAK